MELASIQPLLDWIAQNPNLSGLVVFLVAAAESLALVGIVVPGVVFMLGIGALVGLDAIDFWHAILFAALGAIAGDGISYWLGRHFDQQLRHIWPLSRYPALIPKGENFFNRHGGVSVLFGRFVGPLRPIIPAVAGIMHMPQHKFYVINVVSAVLWAPVVILPGVAFGESIQLASEVFGKLIIVIVVLIVIGVLLGYLVKKAVAYTMMVSIDTLADFFGLRNHEESIVSLTLMGMLVGVLALFVYHYEIRYQPLTSRQQAADYQWWQENWQKFSTTHVKYQSEYPVTFQWWGELNEIDNALQSAGWLQAASFDIKNALNFFLPTAQIARLPAMSETLFNAKDALIMVAQTDNAADYLVFRLWAANPHVAPRSPQLWLGSVYNVSVYSPFDIVHIPLRKMNFSQSLAQFTNRLTPLLSRIKMRNTEYPDIGITDNWRGDVLLLEFSVNQQDQVSKNASMSLTRYQFDDSGISVLAPGPFHQLHSLFSGNDTGSNNRQSAYQYEANGLKLVVEHKRFQNAPPELDWVRDEIRSRLQNMSAVKLNSLDESVFHQGELQGAQLNASFELIPMAKQMNYRIKILMQDNNLWLVTASFKECDNRTRQMITAMLDSVAVSYPK